MKIIDISREMYREFGEELLREAGAYELAAAGLSGQGSECFGWEDETSRDHDVAPGFAIWITREVDATHGFRLMRAYSKLPRSYMGLERSASSAFGARSGTGKLGVRTVEDHMLTLLGADRLPENPSEWLKLPEHGAACFVGGEIFHDGPGIMTELRRILREDIPRDVRLKKLSYHAALMAQSGQYNLPRCHRHGERAAASLAIAEFVNHALGFVFAYENRFMPFYKWSFRAFDEGFALYPMKAGLERLIIGGLAENEAVSLAEEVASIAIEALRGEGLSSSASDYLENHAIALAAGIEDTALRGMHLMEI